MDGRPCCSVFYFAHLSTIEWHHSQLVILVNESRLVLCLLALLLISRLILPLYRCKIIILGILVGIDLFHHKLNCIVSCTFVHRNFIGLDCNICDGVIPLILLSFFLWRDKRSTWGLWHLLFLSPDIGLELSALRFEFNLFLKHWLSGAYSRPVWVVWPFDVVADVIVDFFLRLTYLKVLTSDFNWCKRQFLEVFDGRDNVKLVILQLW